MIRYMFHYQGAGIKQYIFVGKTGAICVVRGLSLSLYKDYISPTSSRFDISSNERIS